MKKCNWTRVFEEDAFIAQTGESLRDLRVALRPIQIRSGNLIWLKKYCLSSLTPIAQKSSKKNWLNDWLSYYSPLWIPRISVSHCISISPRHANLFKFRVLRAIQWCEELTRGNHRATHSPLLPIATERTWTLINVSAMLALLSHVFVGCIAVDRHWSQVCWSY